MIDGFVARRCKGAIVMIHGGLPPFRLGLRFHATFLCQ